MKSIDRKDIDVVLAAKYFPSSVRQWARKNNVLPVVQSGNHWRLDIK